MKENMIEMVDTYDREGYIVKRTANAVPIFIPKEMVPRVQIIDLDTEWVMEKTFITKEQFNNRFK